MTRHWPRLAFLALALASHASAFVAPPASSVAPDSDARPRRSPPGDPEPLRQFLSIRLGVEVVLTLEPIRGGPQTLRPRDPAAFLSPATLEDPEQVARRFLVENRDVFALSTAEVDALRLESRFETRDRGWTHLWFQQVNDLVPIHAARIGVNLGPAARILGVNAGPVVPGLGAGAVPGVAAGQAVLSAADRVGRSFLASEPLIVLEETPLHARYARAHFRSPILADLVHLPTADGAPLAWRVTLDLGAPVAVHEVFIDATSGAMLLRANLVTYHGGGTARAYPIHPIATPQRVLFDLSSVAHPRSPLGWVSAGSTVTVSNNVIAHEDPGSPPDCGLDGLFKDVDPPAPTQNFDYPVDLTARPHHSVPAAITNAFVLANYFHDYLHAYGFDEAAGNFQTDNFGKGGAGGDAIDVQVQDDRDGCASNNASFYTPPDGEPGVLQLNVWTYANPPRDAALDADVVLHEITHGLSNRLVGGPRCVGSCAFGSAQSRAVGEGISDWFAASVTADDAIGEYVSASGNGLRTSRFSQSPYTLRSLGMIAGECEPHADGEIWAATLWDIRENFIAWYGPVAGVTRLERMVVDSLKLVNPSPSFLDARSALLAAAGNDSTDLCLLGMGFARRGMGEGASTLDGGCPTTIVESFTPPVSCTCVAPVKIAGLGANTATPNQVTLTWQAAANAAMYLVDRAEGTSCATATSFRRLGRVSAPASSYVDSERLDGGHIYVYRVTALGRAGLSCAAPAACIVTKAAGNCQRPPRFEGNLTLEPTAVGCGATLAWQPATSNCPLAPTIRYHLWRTTTFPPTATGVPLATVTGTRFLDPDLVGGTRYWYLVRAEDGTTGHEGPGGGNLDQRSVYSGLVAGARTTTVARYDFEAADNEGWTTTTASCNCAPPSCNVRGLFERAVPIATSFGAMPVQEGRDHSPGGEQAWVTENCTRLGCAASEADVDNATQTLFSPRFDCAGATSCYLSAWIAYFSLNPYAGAHGRVEVSSDDGLNWATLVDLEGAREDDAATSTWSRYEYDLATAANLPLTDRMRVRFVAEDCAGTIVEMAVDDVLVARGGPCSACVPAPATVTLGSLLLAPIAGGGMLLGWNTTTPSGAWHLHATSDIRQLDPDSTLVTPLWRVPGSVVATAVGRSSLLDPGSYPPGYYQVFGIDNCTGKSVP